MKCIALSDLHGDLLEDIPECDVLISHCPPGGTL